MVFTPLWVPIIPLSPSISIICRTLLSGFHKEPFSSKSCHSKIKQFILTLFLGFCCNWFFCFDRPGQDQKNSTSPSGHRKSAPNHLAQGLPKPARLGPLTPDQCVGISRSVNNYD